MIDKVYISNTKTWDALCNQAQKSLKPYKPPRDGHNRFAWYEFKGLLWHSIPYDAFHMIFLYAFHRRPSITHRFGYWSPITERSTAQSTREFHTKRIKQEFPKYSLWCSLENRQIPLSRERPRERLSLYGAVGGGGWVKIWIRYDGTTATP